MLHGGISLKLLHTHDNYSISSIGRLGIRCLLVDRRFGDDSVGCSGSGSGVEGFGTSSTGTGAGAAVTLIGGDSITGTAARSGAIDLALNTACRPLVSTRRYAVLPRCLTTVAGCQG